MCLSWALFEKIVDFAGWRDGPLPRLTAACFELLAQVPGFAAPMALALTVLALSKPGGYAA